jgi:hypothetical protein
MVEMLKKEIQSLCNFSFSKIVKVEPRNKFQSFFPERDAFSARKTLLFISFTSLIKMEWTKAPLVGMDLSNMVQFFLIKKKNIWRSFLCYPDCLQMKRIPLITITPTIKVQILRVMACWKALWISHLLKKFQKIQWQIGIVVVCPKSLNSIYGSHGTLGVQIKIKFFFSIK